jgi:hypothetical protein
MFEFTYVSFKELKSSSHCSTSDAEAVFINKKTAVHTTPAVISKSLFIKY